jgi:hypothetical protein
VIPDLIEITGNSTVDLILFFIAGLVPSSIMFLIGKAGLNLSGKASLVISLLTYLITIILFSSWIFWIIIFIILILFLGIIYFYVGQL